MSGYLELNQDYYAPDVIGCHTPSTLGIPYETRTRFCSLKGYRPNPWSNGILESREGIEPIVYGFADRHMNHSTIATW